MIDRYQSVVIELITKLIVPFMQIFALYVITHGHHGPGGGFQGGVILASSIILMRLSLGGEHSDRGFSTKTATILGAIGLMIYGITGLVPFVTGGLYLDYGHLPIPVLEATRRYLGILIVEVGIALAVCGVLVVIFDNLVRRGT